MAKKTVFITGTDTEVGKTHVSAAMLYAAARAGYRTLALKPVAAGCEQTEEGLRNEDGLMLQAAATEPLSYQQVNPIALLEAIAPHVAAVNAGVSLSVQRLAGFCRGVMLKPADLLLIEGAGGWRVPLNDRESFAGVPAALGCDVILVVDLRLGAINHALLTAEAIRRDGLQLAGWVANRVSAIPMQAEAETLAFLTHALGAPRLAELPHQPGADPKALSYHFDDQVIRNLIEK